MAKPFNRVAHSVASAPGTGAATLGGALTGFQTFASAGAVTGDQAPYYCEDGAAREYGLLTYNSTGPTVTRTVAWSTAGVATPLSLTASAVFYCSPRAEDINSSLPNLTSGSSRVVMPQGSNGQIPTAGTGVWAFFDNWQDCRIQEYGFRTHDTGSGQCALALYASGPNGYPTGNPLHAGGLFTPTYAFVNAGYTGLSVVLPRGRIWYALVSAAGASVKYTESASGVNQWDFTTKLNKTVAGTSQANNGAFNKTGMTAGTWPTMNDAYADFSSEINYFLAPNFYIRGA